MTVGILTLQLFLPDAQSLKDKRSLLRPLVESLRRTWNVAVAEVDHQDAWQRAALAVATVNTEAVRAEATLQEVRRHVEERHAVHVLESELRLA